MKNNKRIGAYVGKFYPPHIGHLWVVDSLKDSLDEIYIIISKNDKRNLEIKKRDNFDILPSYLIKEWFEEYFKNDSKVKVRVFDETNFEPYPKDTDKWAEKFKQEFPEINVKIADESYREFNKKYFSEYEFLSIPRDIVNIHSTQIRKDTKNNLMYIIPTARDYFKGEKFMNREFKNLLIDFYELTMGQGYFNKRLHNEIAYFDLFFRKVPDGGSFVIANGVKKCAEYLLQFHFSKSDIEYLKTLNLFSEEYLEYLSTIKFTGDMWAVEDGTIVFPNEPVITIKAPLIEAQLVETSLLLYFNRSSLITTKANRIVRSAKGRAVMEFGSRRAQGEEAAVDGALDAYIGGACGTACTETGKLYGVPVLGTMAHSFVQSFDTEFDAFKAYAESFPDACTLLVDTYNTLESGIPNVIKTYNEVLKPMGKIVKGIRIDSGDLAYLSKRARKMLDEGGLKDTKIVVSNSLDENVISSLIEQNAPIDSFGVGENMITAKSNPVFGGVYKLVAIEKNGEVIPKIKISDNIEKVTNPHFKHIYRLYDKNHKIISDLLCVYNEEKPSKKLVLKHPQNDWVKKEIEDFNLIDIRKHIINNGKLIYKFKSVEETRQKINEELSTLWEEALRLKNPHTYTVNLSNELMDIKTKLLKNEH